VTSAVKRAQAQAFERGRAKGDQEGRQALVEQFRSRAEINSQIIEYLGYDAWKGGAWYVVHVIRRLGESEHPIYSVNDR
jgi:hypothetical protein